MKDFFTFLDANRGKIAAVIGVVVSYLTAVQGSLNTNDKYGVIAAVIAVTYKYLDGNSKYEVSQQYNVK